MTANGSATAAAEPPHRPPPVDAFARARQRSFEVREDGAPLLVLPPPMPFQAEQADRGRARERGLSIRNFDAGGGGGGRGDAFAAAVSPLHAWRHLSRDLSPPMRGAAEGAGAGAAAVAAAAVDAAAHTPLGDGRCLSNLPTPTITPRAPSPFQEGGGVRALSPAYADEVARIEREGGRDRLEIRIHRDGRIDVNGWADASALEELLHDLGPRQDRPRTKATAS